MKILAIPLIIFIIFFCKECNYCGYYFHHSGYVYAYLKINDDNTYKYYWKGEMISDSNTGNWKIKNNEIILNSIDKYKNRIIYQKGDNEIEIFNWENSKINVLWIAKFYKSGSVVKELMHVKNEDTITNINYSDINSDSIKINIIGYSNFIFKTDTLTGKYIIYTVPEFIDYFQNKKISIVSKKIVQIDGKNFKKSDYENIKNYFSY